LARVKHTISHKIQHADAQRILVHQIAYAGTTKECKQAIRCVKNGDLSTWISGTQDIGTQTYMATAHVAALKRNNHGEKYLFQGLTGHPYYTMLQSKSPTIVYISSSRQWLRLEKDAKIAVFLSLQSETSNILDSTHFRQNKGP
jgi:hypothetical protein